MDPSHLCRTLCIFCCSDLKGREKCIRRKHSFKDMWRALAAITLKWNFLCRLLNCFSREFLSELCLSPKMSFGLGFSWVSEDWGWLLSSWVYPTFFLFFFLSFFWVAFLPEPADLFPQSTVVSLDRRVARSSCVLSPASLCRFWFTFFFNQLSAMLCQAIWSALLWWYFPISHSNTNILWLQIL